MPRKDKNKKKNNFTVEDYVHDLSEDSMTGSWDPAGTWHRLHGDGESTTGGKFTIVTMKDSAGKYKVKLMEDGTEVHLLTYDTEPSFGMIVADLKKKFAPEDQKVNEPVVNEPEVNEPEG